MNSSKLGSHKTRQKLSKQVLKSFLTFSTHSYVSSATTRWNNRNWEQFFGFNLASYISVFKGRPAASGSAESVGLQIRRLMARKGRLERTEIRWIQHFFDYSPDCSGYKRCCDLLWGSDLACCRSFFSGNGNVLKLHHPLVLNALCDWVSIVGYWIGTHLTGLTMFHNFDGPLGLQIYPGFYVFNRCRFDMLNLSLWIKLLSIIGLWRQNN